MAFNISEIINYLKEKLTYIFESFSKPQGLIIAADISKDNSKLGNNDQETHKVVEKLFEYSENFNLRLVKSTWNDLIVNHLVANHSISKQSRWVGIFERQLRDKTIEAVKTLNIEALKFCLSYEIDFNEINNLEITDEGSKNIQVYDSCNLLHLLFLTKNPLLDFQQEKYLEAFKLLIKHGVDINHQARLNYNLVRVNDVIPSQFNELIILAKLHQLENNIRQLQLKPGVTKKTIHEGQKKFIQCLTVLIKTKHTCSLLVAYTQELKLLNKENIGNIEAIVFPDLFSLPNHEIIPLKEAASAKSSRYIGRSYS